MISSATLVLSAAELAPWLAEATDVAEVFAASPSAPSIACDPTGRVIVAIDDLNVPLVYGIAAFDWDAALGWDRCATATHEATINDVRLVAITTALETLEQDAPALEQALRGLAAVIGPDDLAELPEGWSQIVAQFIAMSREVYRDHRRICEGIDALERAVFAHSDD